MGIFDELEDDLEVNASDEVTDKVTEILESQFVHYYPLFYDTNLHCVPLSKLSKLINSEIENKNIILYCYSKANFTGLSDDEFDALLKAIKLCNQWLTVWPFKIDFYFGRTPNRKIPSKLYDKGYTVTGTDKCRDKTTVKAINLFNSDGTFDDYDFVIDLNL